MNITIFGGSGRTGIAVINEALNAGHNITAYVRNKTKLEQFKDKIKIVEGSIENEKLIQEAIKDSTVLISTLGHSKGSPPDFQTQFIKTIKRVCADKQNQYTFLILTGSGVYFPDDRPTLLDRFSLKLLKIFDPARLEDGIEHVKELIDSQFQWIVIRVPLLTNRQGNRKFQIGKLGDSSLKLYISRKDLAYAIIGAISNKSYYKTAPVITA